MVYGISLYPQKAPLEENLAYLELAASYGFTKLFLALHSNEMNREKLMAQFSPITARAKELGYYISCDIIPLWMKHLGVNLSFLDGEIALDFFKQLHIDALRLDFGMSEMEEAILSQHIDLELNASLNPHHISGVLAAGGNRDRIALCHNYYPQAQTGVSLQAFEACGKLLAGYEKKATAFVSSQTKASLGPHEMNDGLPTLELHRSLPIEIQARHLMATRYCDSIFIGNAFATEEELKAISSLNPEAFEFQVVFSEECPQTIRDMICGKTHQPRSDSNDLLLRTMSGKRMMPGLQTVEPFHTCDIKKGDILMPNKLFGQYEGELQLALADLPNCGRRNVLGSINASQIMLLDYLKTNGAFSLSAST